MNSGTARAERPALALPQIGADLEDQVPGGRRAQPRQRRQHLGGERAAAGAEFQDDAAGSAARAAAQARATQRANSGEISGAVTKSPAGPNLADPAL